MALDASSALPAIARELRARQRALGAGPLAERNAAALGEGARCVVTGQQPGLLGGPLLVLHKAAGAIAEAARRSTGERPVVPVFWVASDDHDWGEVNQLTVMDGSDHPRVLSLAVRGGGRSVRDVPIDETQARPVLAALAAALGEGEAASVALAAAEPPRLPTDLSSWFSSVLARLLGDSGLVVLDAGALTPWAGDVYAALARSADAIGDAVREAGAARRAGGLAAPLDPPPGQTPLFLREAPGEPRRRVLFRGSRATRRGAGEDLARDAFERLVQTRPELASADVVGRVLLQDALLPVDAYVAGPNEAAYLAQTAPAHALLGLAVPEVVLRPSATWIDRESVNVLRAACLDPENLGSDGPVRWPDAPLGEDAAARRRAANRALEALRPRNKPQERVLSPLSIVARHGLEALRRGLFDVAERRGQGSRLVVLR